VPEKRIPVRPILKYPKYPNIAVVFRPCAFRVSNCTSPFVYPHADEDKLGEEWGLQALYPVLIQIAKDLSLFLSVR
jgi:hypothetical protein